MILLHLHDREHQLAHDHRHQFSFKTVQRPLALHVVPHARASLARLLRRPLLQALPPRPRQASRRSIPSSTSTKSRLSPRKKSRPCGAYGTLPIHRASISLFRPRPLPNSSAAQSNTPPSCSPSPARYPPMPRPRHRNSPRRSRLPSYTIYSSPTRTLTPPR